MSPTSFHPHNTWHLLATSWTPDRKMSEWITEKFLHYSHPITFAFLRSGVGDSEWQNLGPDKDCSTMPIRRQGQKFNFNPDTCREFGSGKAGATTTWRREWGGVHPLPQGMKGISAVTHQRACSTSGKLPLSHHSLRWWAVESIFPRL